MREGHVNGRHRAAGRRAAASLVAISLLSGASACGDDGGTQPGGDDPGSQTEAEFAEYLGLETEAAGALAEQNDRPWRVVREDVVDLAVSMDYVENRLNFAVEDGKVVEVTTG
jgi:hypothetical protein